MVLWFFLAGQVLWHHDSLLTIKLTCVGVSVCVCVFLYMDDNVYFEGHD